MQYFEIEHINIDELKEIIKHHTANNQLLKLMEELGELQQALAKYLQHNHENAMYTHKTEQIKDNLVEEIADVLIMIKQAQLILGIPNKELSYICRNKIERTKLRMETE
jgi:NTP pyrophosphatase (non-canonical NTP hydrolase)